MKGDARYPSRTERGVDWLSGQDVDCARDDDGDSDQRRDCSIINNLAQAVSGIVSVGLKAVALVKDV